MLDRVKFGSDLLKLSFKLASPFGVVLAVSTEGDVAFTKKIELLNTFDQISMLSLRSSRLDSPLALLEPALILAKPDESMDQLTSDKAF